MHIVKRSVSGMNSYMSSMHDSVIEINIEHNGTVLSLYRNHLLVVFRVAFHERSLDLSISKRERHLWISAPASPSPWYSRTVIIYAFQYHISITS